MHRSKLTLKSLELFRETARCGQVQSVAQAAGLSVSTVSHHLRQLEHTLGVQLLDHARRPMALTPEGAAFLDQIDGPLDLLRKAEGAALTGRLSDIRNLRLALIEDFEDEVAPDLARQLARDMPACRFLHLTRPSHDILALLDSRAVDLGLATRPDAEPESIREWPLLRDPYVVALPLAASEDPADLLKGKSDLPFLRYSDDQLMGRQISAHLRRQRLELPQRFCFESTQSMMGMIADGKGWAITTPTNYQRAHRFCHQVQIVPLPGPGFARYISLFARADFDTATAQRVWQVMRRLIRDYVISPAVRQTPWLDGALHMPEAPDDKAFR